ncbi:MAG TPA: hypothetical protein VMZ25_03920 [Terriglobales bacterium]|nr:hypothetical protein [Terriglobales bacterium]
MRRFFLLLVLVCLGCTAMVSAQDAVKVDPKHYTIVSENDQVRVLKVHYGPHEKSVMHSHPGAVIVFLSDAKMKFNFADGKTQDAGGKTGESMFTPPVTHLPENTGDKAMDGILVEIKTKASPGKSAAAKKK